MRGILSRQFLCGVGFHQWFLIANCLRALVILSLYAQFLPQLKNVLAGMFGVPAWVAALYWTIDALEKHSWLIFVAGALLVYSTRLCLDANSGTIWRKIGQLVLILELGWEIWIAAGICFEFSRHVS